MIKESTKVSHTENGVICGGNLKMISRVKLGRRYRINFFCDSRGNCGFWDGKISSEF